MLVTVSLRVVRQQKAGEGCGEILVKPVTANWFHPGPVPCSHVDRCLTRPVVIVFINFGRANLPALDLDVNTSGTTGVRLSVEVEDVDTRHRGSEVRSGRVEAAPLVVEDNVKLHVGGRIR